MVYFIAVPQYLQFTTSSLCRAPQWGQTALLSDFPVAAGLYTDAEAGFSATTGLACGPLVPEIAVPQYLQRIVPTTCLAPQCGHITLPSFTFTTGAGAGAGFGLGSGDGAGLGGMGLPLLMGVPQNRQNAASFSCVALHLGQTVFFVGVGPGTGGTGFGIGLGAGFGIPPATEVSADLDIFLADKESTIAARLAISYR